METTIEVWKTIDEHENYEVSNFGNVRKSKTKLILKPKAESGYLHVILVCSDGKRRQYLIHRLVAKAFVENPESKELVIHKDKDHSNNHSSNLVYVSRSEITKKITKTVIYYSDENPCLGIFDTSTLASEVLKIPKAKIISCCKGEITDYEGMKFRFV